MIGQSRATRPTATAVISISSIATLTAVTTTNVSTYGRAATAGWSVLITCSKSSTTTISLY